MIIGVGTDLCDISRIYEILLRFPYRLAERILTKEELKEYPKNINHQAAFLAKRFAAKEATAKALGVGIGLISWTDIEIKHNKNGAPCLNLKNMAKKIANDKGVNDQYISLSDESRYALAFVVLS